MRLTSIQRSRLTPEIIRSAQIYARIEWKKGRATFAERVQALHILIMTGVAHMDLLLIGRMSRSH